MAIGIIITFIIGYFAITLEHSIKVNKAATALVTGVICWTIYIVFQPDKHLVTEQLMEHLGEVSGILFFLLGAVSKRCMPSERFMNPVIMIWYRPLTH